MFSNLLTAIEAEKSKIDKFSPGRYLVATSLPLTLTESKKIKAALEPHVKDTNDVYDKAELNKYLARNPDIVQQYFKLWLTSATILKTIINNAQDAGSRFVAERIKKNILLYVKNRHYHNAVQKLEEHSFILITGLPGVGKTILSYILICELLSKGFRLVYVDQDVKAAEAAFDENENVKQVFLFDDFLGANYNEIINPKSSHSSIVAFVERIQATPNKYCILTTRTNILKKANISSEKLRRSSIEVSKMEIEVRDYDIVDKGRILYDHLIHNSLPPEYIEQIFHDKNYWKIIKHGNYNPRIVEFITSKNILKQVEGGRTYLDCVLFNLDNPDEIWRHAFENQIDKDDQLLVYTLFTFPHGTDKNVLEVAFNNRIRYEISQNGYQKSNNSYENSIERLLDGFIAGTRYDEKISFQFINPSINDFLLSYLGKSKEERLKLVDSSVYFSQFKSLITTYDHFRRDISLPLKDEWLYLVERIVSLGIDTNFSDLNWAYVDDQGKKLSIANLLCRMSYWILEPNDLNDRIDDVMLSYFKECDFEELIEWDCEQVVSLFYNIPIFEKTQEFLRPKFVKLMTIAMDAAWTLDHFKDIKSAFDALDVDWNAYMETRLNASSLKDRLIDIISDQVKDFVSDEKHSVYREGELDDLKDRAYKEWNDYANELGLVLDFDEDSLFNDIDEQDLIESNTSRIDGDDFDDTKPATQAFSHEDQVDYLFSKKGL